MRHYTHLLVALSILGSLAAQASERPPSEEKRIQCYFEEKAENGQKKDKEKSVCYVRAEVREEHHDARDAGGPGILHGDRDEGKLVAQCSNGFTIYDRDADVSDSRRDISIIAQEFDKIAFLDIQDSHGGTTNATFRTQAQNQPSIQYNGYCRVSEEH
ncbi:hypothetical protein EBS43_12225 [bacterium]|nr:hypothetical protein [bacterium]